MSVKVIIMLVTGGRTADFESLDDLREFKIIAAAVPIYKVIIVFDELSLSEIQIESALVESRRKHDQEKKLRELKIAEDRLTSARVNL